MKTTRRGIPEYWRFDETGEYYGERLVGDRLVGGVYRTIPVERLSEGTLQGRSDVLGLDIRWRSRNLEWHDPLTGRHIVTLDDERVRAEMAQTRARELEEELRQLRGE